MTRKLKNLGHLVTAILANIIFGFPGRKITVIGVTGTDGKTTTVNLLYHILKENGYKASMLSSINAVVGNKIYDTGFHVTTPGRSFLLLKLLNKAEAQGSKYFVLEVTSHALDQHRVWGIPFRVGVLTNVSNEHLDYHKTYENYVRAKEKLIRKAKVAIVNIDDRSYPLLLRTKSRKEKGGWITYGLSAEALVGPRDFPQVEKAQGEFNKYNFLAAATAASYLGLPKEGIGKALKSFKLPVGRLDLVYDKDFKVIIDFAHTPNAFDKLLSTVKPKSPARLIHVFGSAGERDYFKRPLMGEISAKYADIIVITAEDPRTENVNDIISQIRQGVGESRKVLEIANRKEAINEAIKLAKTDDVVVITGKSHEKSMAYQGIETPWNEYQAVRDALENRNGKN